MITILDKVTSSIECYITIACNEMNKKIKLKNKQLNQIYITHARYVACVST